MATTKDKPATCQRCGRCCINNGLIPPLIALDESPDLEAPEWMLVMAGRLRAHFAAVAEDFPCVFLTDDHRCAVHDVFKPRVCRDFACEDW